MTDRVRWESCLVVKRREQIYRESETTLITDEIIRSSPICVNFYNPPFYFLMWLRWDLVPYNQKSQKRCEHDTYLLMKIEWSIGKMIMNLNLFSWMECYSNWSYGFGKNKQEIVLKDCNSFSYAVRLLFLSFIVIRWCWAHGLQQVPCPLGAYIPNQILIC